MWRIFILMDHKFSILGQEKKFSKENFLQYSNSMNRKYYLISFNLAAFPVSSRIYPIFLRRTLNCRSTTILEMNGELIGKIFSIPIPSMSVRTVITLSSCDFHRIEIMSPRKSWIRSFSPSLIIWCTSISIPVLSSWVSDRVWVLACIAAIRVESISENPII